MNHQNRMAVVLMASYTMTLKECLETLLTFKGIDCSTLSTKQLIEEGRKTLFDFQYPVLMKITRVFWKQISFVKCGLGNISGGCLKLNHYKMLKWL